MSERAFLTRINLREPEGPPGTLSFPLSAASALTHRDRPIR